MTLPLAIILGWLLLTTCVGILAHESALKGGEVLRLPDWSF